MSDEELFEKVSPIGAILKDVFKEEIEKQDKVIQEIFEQTREELDNDKRRSNTNNGSIPR